MTIRHADGNHVMLLKIVHADVGHKGLMPGATPALGQSIRVVQLAERTTLDWNRGHTAALQLVATSAAVVAGSLVRVEGVQICTYIPIRW